MALSEPEDGGSIMLPPASLPKYARPSGHSTVKQLAGGAHGAQTPPDEPGADAVMAGTHSGETLPGGKQSAEKRGAERGASDADQKKLKRRRTIGGKRGSSSIWSTLAASQVTEAGKYKFHCNVCGHIGATNKNYSTSNIIDHFKAKHPDLRRRLMGMHDVHASEAAIRAEISAAHAAWQDQQQQQKSGTSGGGAPVVTPFRRVSAQRSAAAAHAAASAAAAAVAARDAAISSPDALLKTLSLDGSIKAASRRVMVADSELAVAQTEDCFESATRALDKAVKQLERVVDCKKRCAALASSLGQPLLSPASPPPPNGRPVGPDGAVPNAPARATHPHAPREGSADAADGVDMVE